MIKLKSWLDAERGRATSLATHLGVSLSRISQIAEDGVPPKYMLSVRDFTGGVVSLESMVEARTPQTDTAQAPAPIAPAATESIAKPIAHKPKPSEPTPADLKPRVAPRRHDEKPSPYAHTDIDRRGADGLTDGERRAKAQAAAEAAENAKKGD